MVDIILCEWMNVTCEFRTGYFDIDKKYISGSVGQGFLGWRVMSPSEVAWVGGGDVALHMRSRGASES